MTALGWLAALYNARGIRLLGSVLSDARRDGIIKRTQSFGIPVPKFIDDGVSPGNISRKMPRDFEGNQIELVFKRNDAPNFRVGLMQTGLIASNMAMTGQFLL